MKAARKKHRRFPPRSGRAPTLDGPPERLRVTLTDFGPYGDAVGHAEDGRPVHVAYGLPGEEVVVEVRGEDEGKVIAEVVQVVSASPHRVEPQCAHFGTCGGCQLQHMDYPSQLEFKRRIVVDRLRKVGGLIDAPVSPVVGADDPWHYRNNARFTVRGREGNVGFTHWYTHRFLPIGECPIMDPRINAAKAALDGRVAGARQLAVRVGRNTESYLIHPALEERDDVTLETGQLGHEERLFGVPFRISAASFFQVNTTQAERMAALVRDRLKLKGTDLLLDAFAGVGTFAALFAPLCARVVAIEESASAVLDARTP